MSGFSGHAIGLVRRGLELAPGVEEYLAPLKQQQTNSFDNEKPVVDINPRELVLPVITVIVVSLGLTLVGYTLREVLAVLAMIEQPKTVVVAAEQKGSDPDAPLEKTPLMVEEVMVLREVPITSSIRKTIRLLHQTGGFSAHFRGFGASMVYHLAHGLASNFLLHILTMAFPILARGGQIITAIVASILLARIHMTWTHVMISQPSPLPWFKRIPGGRQVFKTLVLPSAVFAIAQHLTILLPVGVFYSFGPLSDQSQVAGQEHLLALRLFAAIATAGATAILVLLPAAVTLTRIEASLLPEDQETIVSFDRTLNGAATSAISLGTSRSNKALFVEAWRSFDMQARVRIIKFYIKTFFIQIAILLVGTVVLAAAFSLIESDRIINIAHEGAAQLQQAAGMWGQ